MTTIPKRAKKNPAAVALGRLGGSAGTPAQQAARRKNAKRGGRPPRPRIRRYDLARVLRDLKFSLLLTPEDRRRVQEIIDALPRAILVD